MPQGILNKNASPTVVRSLVQSLGERSIDRRTTDLERLRDGERPHAVGLHPLDLGGVDGRPASRVDAACLRGGCSFKLALAAQVSNSANTPSIFFDDQTRQLAAAHADLSLVRPNRGPIEPRVGRQIVGASDARHHGAYSGSDARGATFGSFSSTLVPLPGSLLRSRRPPSRSVTML